MGLAIGLLNVRRSIFIKAPPQRVWREFASFEAIAKWFGVGQTLHALDLRVGGAARLSVEIGAQRRFFGGPVVVLDAPHELSMEWNWDPPHAWPVPSLVTIRLTPLYDGSLVEIFHHGFERLGAAAADELEGYELGWDIRHLKALRGLVED